MGHNRVLFSMCPLKDTSSHKDFRFMQVFFCIKNSRLQKFLFAKVVATDAFLKLHCAYKIYWVTKLQYLQILYIHNSIDSFVHSYYHD